MNPHQIQEKLNIKNGFERGIRLIKPNLPADRNIVRCFYDDGATDTESAVLCLSAEEHEHAGKLSDPIEKRQFILRRSFQRIYVKTITDFAGTLPSLELKHQRDQATIYAPQPKLCLSFSSSGQMFAAASSREFKIGIDIEQQRAIAWPIALSERFFHPREVEYLSALNPASQQSEFLKYWTIKEACLKAIGKGVVYGLEAFVIRKTNFGYKIDPPADYGVSSDWKIETTLVNGGYWVTIAQFDKNTS